MVGKLAHVALRAMTWSQPLWESPEHCDFTLTQYRMRPRDWCEIFVISRRLVTASVLAIHREGKLCRLSFHVVYAVPLKRRKYNGCTTILHVESC